MKKNLAIFFVLFLSVSSLKSETYKLYSPQKRIMIGIEVNNEVSWDLYMDGIKIMGPSTLSLSIADIGVLGYNTNIKRALQQSEKQTIHTPFYRKKVVNNEYNQIVIELDDGLGIVFRAYDDGIAYRLFSSFDQEVVILNEQADFVFSENKRAWIPYIVPRDFDSYSTSFESTYDILNLRELVADSLIILPTLVEAGEGYKVVITEADLEDYPGMFLTVNKDRNGFSSHFAPYPLEEKPGGHNNLQSVVTKRAHYIAKTWGKRNFPWRVFALSSKDADLIDNDLVAKLASPCRISDLSWIKPGKVAWDWWNDLNIRNVDFRAGVNTETYKYYIDFAAKHGVEYVILDEGWSEQESLLQIKPYIDLEEIIRHAQKQGVGIILWAGWLPLNLEMEEVMKTYSKMGVAGYKIDFMDRDDQAVVNFYYEVAEMAAKYKQIVNFHGAYKPTGLQFTYPNVLTFEGVYGLENVKWTDYLDMPLYDVTIPFIRAIAGPMDYTPGAMINSNRWNWRAIHSSPMSQGTRCHQLAMYVIYESPLSMMADSPTNYINEVECTHFIASVPQVFDETKVLLGELGEYLALARRKGKTWYVGAMTNWYNREIKIDLTFLDEGEYEGIIFRDGINADRNAQDYVREVIKVNKDTILNIDMAPGGGWVGAFSEQ